MRKTFFNKLLAIAACLAVALSATASSVIVKATEKRGLHAVSTIIFPTEKLWEK